MHFTLVASTRSPLGFAERHAKGDLAEARELIDWLAKLAADGDPVMLEIMLLRLRAVMAMADGDDVVYSELVERYRAMAESLEFGGHVAWAKEMAQGHQ